MTLRSIRRTTVLLAGLCLVLVGGVVLEWLKPPRLSPVSGEAAQPGQPLIAREPAPGSVSLPPLSKYEEIISRPLFLADRRPPPAMPESPAEPVAEQEATLLLVGVMLSPEGQRALVHLKEENRLVRLQVGESAGGWKLEAITPDSATLSQGEDTLKLQLERNRKDGPPPPSQAAPRTPPPPRTARPAPAASQPQQAPAQKGVRAPATAPQQPPQAGGRQARTPPAAPGRPVSAPGARQPASQAPAAPGRTAAPPPARAATPPPARASAPPPAAPSPRLQQQLDAITPGEEPMHGSQE